VLLHGLAHLSANPGLHDSWLIETSWLLDLLSDRRVELLDVLPQRRDVQRTGDPEGPWERSAPISEVDAGQVRVHGCSSTGQATGGVDGENSVGHDDTQQGGLHGPDPATHAGAHRAREVGR
jgi:hypothetical protein